MFLKSIQSLNIWLIFSFFISIIIILPIIVIFANAISVDSVTWQHIYNILFIEYTFNTLILVFGVSSLTFILGTVSAWIVSFYHLPFKKLLSFLLIMPIAIPPYAVAYCYADITDFDNIFINLIPSVRSIGGAIFILSLTLFPYVYLICRNSFLNNSKSILESAANLGCGRISLFLKFGLPISRPAIVASLALVIMETLADFGVVHYLGINSLSVGIYKSWFGLDDLNSSARIASILFTFSFLVIFIERFSRRKKIQRYMSYGKGRSNYLFQDKYILPFVFIIFVILISLLIPITWLIACVLSNDKIFSEELLFSTLNSFKLGILGAIIITISASIICFYKRASKNNSSFLFNLVKIGYASPGIVVAIGVLVPMLYVDKKLNNIFQIFDIDLGLFLSSSIFILIIAYLVRFLSVGLNPVEAAYEKISNKIDFVAENLKASRNKIFYRVHMPMIHTSITIAFLLVFIEIIKELPATLILRPFNFNTLSIYTFEFASSEQLILAAAPALLITCLAILPLLFIHFLHNKIEGGI